MWATLSNLIYPITGSCELRESQTTISNQIKWIFGMCMKSWLWGVLKFTGFMRFGAVDEVLKHAFVSWSSALLRMLQHDDRYIDHKFPFDQLLPHNHKIQVVNLSCTISQGVPSIRTSKTYNNKDSLIVASMGLTWGQPGAARTQVGPMLAKRPLLSGLCYWTYG